MSESEVRVIKCDDWPAFISAVRSPRNMFGKRIFRGQRDVEWRLASVWERNLDRLKGTDKTRSLKEVAEDGALDQIRDWYLERFKNLATGTVGLESTGLSDNDWWALGRHHNLTTPLLDWTYSPYVAAYFAFIDLAESLNPGFRSGSLAGPITFGDGDVAVWEFVFNDSMPVDAEFEVFTARTDRALRQKAQRGVFTKLAHHVHVDLESYLTSRGLGNHLFRFEIPSQEMGRALCDLDLMNINASTVFPDLEGAAARANQWDWFETLGKTGK